MTVPLFEFGKCRPDRYGKQRAPDVTMYIISTCWTEAVPRLQVFLLDRGF